MRSSAIARRSPEACEQDPVDFLSLRARAIALAQAASGQRWTDYNLHDPGVTILEQVCFAMTELAYRADFPVADHLTGSDRKIDFQRQALFPPDEIFPCRPTSLSDYRRLLLDHLPDLGDARFTVSRRAVTPGLHHLRLRLAHRHSSEERGAARRAREDARRLLRANRNLAEDIDDVIQPITPTFCELELEAGIEGVRDPIDILADIYIVSAAWIGGLVQPKSFDELLRAHRPLEDIFDGPAWVNGVIDRADIDRGASGRLSVADLRATLLQIDGVADVARLVVHMDGEPASPVLKWDPARTALRLRMPGARQQPASTKGVQLNRRGVPVGFDYHALARRCADRARPGASQSADKTEAKRLPPPLPLAPVLPPQKGVYREPLPFHSVREHFPTVYGLRTDSAAAFGIPPYERGDAHLHRERAGQMKAYLALFDHVLANGAAQLDHVRDLFAVEGDFSRSYWRRLLSDSELAGIERLYTEPREGLQDAVYWAFDDAAARRSEVMDYLLSLYGETFAQNTSRQFLDHLDSTELADALLENKRAYLQQTVVLGRDRVAGFDYGERLWNNPDQTTGLHRRIALLCAFRNWHARSLTAALGRWRPREMPDKAVAADVSIRPLSWGADDGAPAPSRRPLTLPPAALHRALFVNGLYRNRYGWRANGSGDGGTLLLRAGPADDESGATPATEGWWELRRFASEAGAARYAALLRAELLRRTDGCEGLHIVEHILLRPRSRGSRPTPEFHALRATLVLPDWTSRTGLRAFKAFAEETVRINCPAHVTVDCLWLDLPSMKRFERLYMTWLRRLRLAAEAGAISASLDDAADALTEFLLDQGVDPGPGLAEVEAG